MRSKTRRRLAELTPYQHMVLVLAGEISPEDVRQFYDELDEDDDELEDDELDDELEDDDEEHAWL